MTKAGKIVLTIVSVVIVLIISAWLFVGALWTGAFNFMFPEEIATYHSPNGEYSLVFEQMGDPAWPFGPADVRLTLKNHTGKMIERVSAQVFNDGGSASKDNIASISWNDDAVIIVLSACEMEDKEVSIAYSKAK
jgi:hypothetical protein